MTSSAQQWLAPGVWLLQGFASERARPLFAAVETIEAAAPFRHLKTPGGLPMSVAMTNCGEVGWVSDHRGYRYESCDPMSGQPWLPMPAVFSELAEAAADLGGFPGFVPDACLINRYVPGARMTLHQDKDERDFGWPIVSVSLGLPAVFLLGGVRRSDKPRRVPLEHGDVLVWGGAARLLYHGVLAVKAGQHDQIGRAPSEEPARPGSSSNRGARPTWELVQPGSPANLGACLTWVGLLKPFRDDVSQAGSWGRLRKTAAAGGTTSDERLGVG
jgi:alkylated DNA repair protein (DNA oxidative demethylase)